MKKILMVAALVLCAVGSNAQIVVNSKFKTMSYDEMMAPILMAQRFHQECLANLSSLLEQTEQAEQFISKDKDPMTWNLYADCYDAIVDEYNSINQNGTNQGTRRAIADLRKRSSSVLSRIRSASNRRDRLSADQYSRLRATEGLTCSRYYSDISLDEFMDGKTPVVTYQTREYNATQR